MTKVPTPIIFGIIAVLCLAASPLQASAKSAKANKASHAEKEKVILLPMQISADAQSMVSEMQAAVVQGLEQKYLVYSGDRVLQELKKAANKENHSAKHDCDETRCLQDISIAFQTENVAVVHITKVEGGYLLSLSIKDVMSNEAVFDNSVTCESCSVFRLIEKLKELSSTVAPAVSAPEAPQAKINLNDPDGVLWAEAQKGNTVDDYQVYLDTYPKGKYKPFAIARIKKLKEAAQAIAEQQEQQAWGTAEQEGSEDSYGLYLKGYPTGRFAGLAKVRLDKLKNDVAAKEETRLWKTADSSNDQAAIESYLTRYPSGRYIAAASAKLAAIKAEAAKGPAMVRIPGKNYEMGKYDVTRGEFAKFVSETGYDAGNSCYFWTGSAWKSQSGSNWRNPGFNQDDTHPVTCVNWNDAQAYATWLSKKTGKQYRLPNEAEWEYACYGGSQTEYCGGSDLNAVAWYHDNSNSTTHTVGQKQANGYGLYDMSGNVWQLMENRYDNEHDRRALRGGSWNDGAGNLRAALRGYVDPTGRVSYFGFRLARTLP